MKEDKSKVIPMMVKDSDDPCVYNPSTGEFEKFKIPYELDDNPLTDEQINEIRSLSTASDLPDESFDQSLI